jgi:hypothetical protein
MKVLAFTTAAAITLLAVTIPPAFADDKKVAVSTDADRTQVWMNSRAKTWNSEHKTWDQRGGYTAYRVPDDKYAMYYGSEHTFRVNTLPYRMVDSEPRYQYNGAWMTVVDPWPESWQQGWWNNDDVYVRYDNGYYLYNNKYPDVPLAVRFSK